MNSIVRLWQQMLITLTLFAIVLSSSLFSTGMPQVVKAQATYPLGGRLYYQGEPAPKGFSVYARKDGQSTRAYIGDNGSYQFQLAAGKYTIYPERLCPSNAPLIIDVPTTSQVPDIYYDCPTERAVSGYVLVDGEYAWDGFGVKATAANGTITWATVKNGWYRFSGATALANGTYTISHNYMCSSTPINVTVPPPVDAYPIIIKCPEHILTGYVTIDGRPAPRGFGVVAKDTNGTEKWYQIDNDWGMYKFVGLVTGTYNIGHNHPCQTTGGNPIQQVVPATSNKGPNFDIVCTPTPVPPPTPSPSSTPFPTITPAPTSVSFSIVREARLDIGMPYDPSRGCSSPYVGCSGPFHGFYKGVCTDVALDSYNAGASFNINNALAHDTKINNRHYAYGSRWAPDMLLYFKQNQLFLTHAQPYQPGDITFFDFNADGITDHVTVISGVDNSGRPLKMVDAPGEASWNPSGLALENTWSDYYAQHSQGHARLKEPSTDNIRSTLTEDIQYLRITEDSQSTTLRLVDANGRYRSNKYDENLIASNNIAFVPYIPYTTYTETAATTVITVAQPEINSIRYIVEIRGQTGGTYRLTIETLENQSVTDSQVFEGNIKEGDIQNVLIELDTSNGSITFAATAPVVSPIINLPELLYIVGDRGALIQTTFDISEITGKQPVNNITVSLSNLFDQGGGTVPSSKLSITPASFNLTAGSTQRLILLADTRDLMSGTYQGSLILTSPTKGTSRIPVALKIKFDQLFLPIVRN